MGKINKFILTSILFCVASVSYVYGGYKIISIAGNGSGGYFGDGSIATSAKLNYPNALALDTAGNLYIADSDNNWVRQVGTNGIISIAAGGASAGYTGDGAPATNASLSCPAGVAVDGFGDLFIADFNNGCVRKVGTNGIITTVAGNGTGGYSGDGGPATNALLSNPSRVAVDYTGNLFIADHGNNVLREVQAQGATLAITNVSANNAGSYDVVITSSFGSVTSSVVALSVALSPLQPVINNANGLDLQLSGSPGATYILQSTVNLSPPILWQAVVTNAADATGKWSYAISNITSPGADFYRVKMR